VDSLMILAGTSNIAISTCRYFGRSFVRVKASTVVYTYCIEENFWFEETTTTPLATSIASTSIGTTMVNYAISNVSTSGKVYVMNHAALVFTDDGVAYTARMQLAPHDHGTRHRKFWSDVELVCDREESASATTLSYSDDDYQTWTTWGDLDLSDERPRATRLGASRKRAWALSNAASTPMGIEALEGNFEVGA